MGYFRDLLERAQAGDQEAMLILIRRYLPKMKRIRKQIEQLPGYEMGYWEDIMPFIQSRFLADLIEFDIDFVQNGENELIQK